MRYGIVLPGGTAGQQLELAVLAERSGWDGVFVWEAAFGVDAWSLLAAMATRTERVRLGTMLTPLPWRRPWKVASQLATLDQLSNGRAILAVGLGAVDPELGDTGEETDRRRRAAMMDEGIDMIRGLLDGRLRFRGEHYRVDLEPRAAIASDAAPVQPRVPIWVVGAWPRPKSMRRVLRCDGILPMAMDHGEIVETTPDHVVALLAWLRERGGAGDGFDVVTEGETPASGGYARVKPWAEAGCTWWLETRWMLPAERTHELRERIEAGPPAPG